MIRVSGAVDSAVCRSAQAVDLRGGLVGDPVGCLVRRLCYLFHLGARWIRSATGPSAIALHWCGSIHAMSVPFKTIMRQECYLRRSSRACGRTIWLSRR
jgi:hypothetical protein